MKRFIFSAIALMVAATACTESGIIDMPDFYGNAIVFNTYIGKTPVTKAVSVDETYLQKSQSTGGGVHVTAFLKNQTTGTINFDSAYLDADMTYVKEDGSNPAYWSYGETAYWPDGEDLAFAAYSLNAESCVVQGTQNLTGFDFQINEDKSEQVDLLAVSFDASQVTDQSGDKQITLNFLHLLSRIGYKVYATDSGVDITIQSIKLCGAFPSKGKVDLRSNPAAIQPYAENGDAYTYSYEFFNENESFAISSDECSPALANAKQIYTNKKGASTVGDTEDYYLMIMPGQIDETYIEVTYLLAEESKPYYARVDLGNWNFRAGYAYEFVFKIATASIEFSAEVVEGSWDEQTPEEKPL